MQEKNNKNIVRTMMSVSGIVILSKVLGFIKQMITANAFGATIQTDLISLSEGLVANTDYLLVQALATAFIPTYIYSKSNGDDQSEKFVSNTIKVFFTITVAISLLFTLISPIIARILAPTYSDELSRNLAKYIRIFAPVIILIVELAIFNALLKANEHFVPGELIGFNQSVILIILIFTIGSKVGPDTLVIGFYAYAVFNLIFLMVFSRKYWKVKKGNPFKDSNVQRMLKMMAPLLLGYAMVFINQQVDKVIVSGLGAGTVTAMGYASVLSNFVCTFIGSISGVLFTYITQNIAGERDKEAARLTTNSIIQLVTILLPISILTVANASDIVNIVFGRGKFDASAVSTCAYALIGYGLMFVPYVIREIFSRVQYAYEDSKRPMINSSIAIVFNIVFSILLSRFLGVLGVTLATSISVLICAILNMISSYHRNHYLELRSYIRYLPKWLIGVAVCFGISIIGKNLLTTLNPLFRFAIVVLVSLSIYMVFAYPIVKPVFVRLIRRKK